MSGSNKESAIAYPAGRVSIDAHRYRKEVGCTIVNPSLVRHCLAELHLLDADVSFPLRIHVPVGQVPCQLREGHAGPRKTSGGKRTHVTTTLPWMSSNAKLGVGPSSSLGSAATPVGASSAEPACLPSLSLALFVPALLSSFLSLSLAVVGDEPCGREAVVSAAALGVGLLASEAEESAGAVAAAAEAEGEVGVQRGVNAPVAEPGLRKNRPSDSKASNLSREGQGRVSQSVSQGQTTQVCPVSRKRRCETDRCVPPLIKTSTSIFLAVAASISASPSGTTW